MMRLIKFWQVDAFTDRPFRGNPAAVCWLDQEEPGDWMQAVAAEINLSETAFLARRDDGYSLRWFTPTTEVDLCGHATLASAHALWTEHLHPLEQPIRFMTRSGLLVCQRRVSAIELNFPATPAREVAAPEGLSEALGLSGTFVGRTPFDFLVVAENAEAVRHISPDFGKLRQIDSRGVIVTSRSDDPRYDCISRFFAPAVGIDEDPVTGSAHCCLGPFWADALGKAELTAYQASPRGGVLHIRQEQDRVILGGQAVTTIRGELVGV